MWKGNRISLTAGLIVSALGAAAYGQADIDRFNRQLEQIQRQTILEVDKNLSLDQRALFDYGGYFTFGYLSADDNVNDNHVLRQYQVFGYARMNLDGANELFLRGEWTWQDFNDGDAFNRKADNSNQGDIDRWYWKFDLARYNQAYNGRQIDYNVVTKVGRDLVIWGNGLVLSQDVMGFEGAFSWHGTDVTVLAGVTPKNTVDFDTSRSGFEDNTTRGLYGAMISHDVGGHKPYMYGLFQQDYNGGGSDETVTGPVTTDYQYNSYYLGVGSTGPITDRLLYGIEAVYEGGSSLSNSATVAGGGLAQLPQTDQEIQAWAGDLRLDYLFPDVRHSRLSGEVILASGDDDRLSSSSNTFGGNKSGTKDRAFNAFGLLNTGLAFAPAVSNLFAVRIGGSTFPLPDMGPLRRLQVGTDLFLYNRLEGDAPIDEPVTSEQRYLGWEPDFYMNWQATSDLTITLRYGVFFPDSGVFPSDDARQYFYGGMTYAF